MKRAAPDEDRAQKKRALKTCLACMGVASTTWDYCPRGCHYDICIDCVFGFTEMRFGSTFDRMRIKCLICREPFPAEENEGLVQRLLSRRPRFYAMLEDTVSGGRVVLAKDSKTNDITLSKVGQFVNERGVTVSLNGEDVSLVTLLNLATAPILPRHIPVYVPRSSSNPSS